MSYNSSWTNEDLKKLGMALTFAYKNSDAYGQPLELQSRVDAFSFVLADDYTVEQVLYAIKLHMKRSTDMVKPAHISAALSPEKPKISTAEFFHAQKQWEINGYKTFCSHKEVIDAYREQESEQREEHAKVTDERALKLLGSFKKDNDNREVTDPNGYEKLN